VCIKCCKGCAAPELHQLNGCDWWRLQAVGQSTTLLARVNDVFARVSQAGCEGVVFGVLHLQQMSTCSLLHIDNSLGVPIVWVLHFLRLTIIAPTTRSFTRVLGFMRTVTAQ